MRFTQEIFNRATLQGVTDYLLNGSTIAVENESYETRLDNAYYKHEKIAMAQDKEKAAELIDSANEMAGVIANVYTEIGMQAGFLLIQDLLQNVGVSGKKGANYKGMYEQLFKVAKEALQLIKSGEQGKVDEAVKTLEMSIDSLEKL